VPRRQSLDRSLLSYAVKFDSFSAFWKPAGISNGVRNTEQKGGHTSVPTAGQNGFKNIISATFPPIAFTTSRKIASGQFANAKLARAMEDDPQYALYGLFFL
jgi:hypothetical protein